MAGQTYSNAPALENCYLNIYYDINAIIFSSPVMPAVTIRNLPDEVHRALKIRAAQHNRSTEAEMRAILEAAVRPEGRVRLGTALSQASRSLGLTNADIEALEQAGETSAAEPMRFE